MQNVTDLPKRQLNQYTHFMDPKQQSEIIELAKSLEGKKIIEVNATAYGGGVAELLRGKIALLQGLGVDASWYVLPPNDEFFHTTKTLHNCLQGRCEPPTSSQIEHYQNYLKNIATELPQDADVYVLHDPQTLGLAPYLPAGKIIWRCHIDLTESAPNVLKWLSQYYQYFNKIVFSLESYQHGADRSKVAIVHPSIDPLSIKNADMTPEQVNQILLKHNIDESHPYIVQISRFDRFKDPLGVIEIYRDLIGFMPQYRLLLVGNTATDDPEGKAYFEKVQGMVKMVDEHIQLITEASDLDINALQRGAGAVIQNSHREGFGLTVTESLWKQQLVFSRPVGGIAIQIVNGKTGFYLEENAFESSEKLVEVLRRPDEYLQVRMQARELVRQKFLLPTMVHDFMQVYLEVLQT